MAKKEDDDKSELTDEDEVFAAYGIEDDNAKKRVRELAAARHLANRRINAKPGKKKEDSPWGSE